MERCGDFGEGRNKGDEDAFFYTAPVAALQIPRFRIGFGARVLQRMTQDRRGKVFQCRQGDRLTPPFVPQPDGLEGASRKVIVTAINGNVKRGLSLTLDHRGALEILKANTSSRVRAALEAFYADVSRGHGEFVDVRNRREKYMGGGKSTPALWTTTSNAANVSSAAAKADCISPGSVMSA